MKMGIKQRSREGEREGEGMTRNQIPNIKAGLGIWNGLGRCGIREGENHQWTRMNPNSFDAVRIQSWERSGKDQEGLSVEERKFFAGRVSAGEGGDERLGDAL